jgi:rare lipoprotein A
MVQRTRHDVAAMCLVLAVMLGACAEAELVAHTAKLLQSPPGQPTPERQGHYKIGTPYQISGVWYYPKVDYGYRESGIASWYGPGFHQNRTANGEIFDQNLLTAAHPTLPLPSMVRVTNLDNGRSIAVRVNDRGPFKNGRIIDLSRRAAQLLGFEGTGTAKVLVEIMAAESRQFAAAALSEWAMAAAPEPAPVVAVSSQPLTPDAQFQADGLSSGTSDHPPSSAVATAAVRAAPSPDLVVTRRPVGPSSIYVQAGAFTRFENASRLHAQLADLGESRIQPARVSGQQFYRVRLGPVGSVEEADRLLSVLIERGHTNVSVVVD